MPQTRHAVAESGPQCDTTGRFSVRTELSDLASALTALTASELADLGTALNDSDSWDSAGSDRDTNGSFLTNLF